YPQLESLTNFETLKLGIPFDPTSPYYRPGVRERRRLYEGVAMSLDSGLSVLRGLKKLHFVGLEDMEVYIGRQEKLWMRRNWPASTCLTTNYFSEPESTDDGEDDDDEDEQ
ncbi:hypothetical protein BGW39_003603, partial [Mortierella sp. 14UC]